MLQTVFDLDLADYRAWPREERALGLKLASEAFLLRCNPFVHPEVVKNSTSQELNRNAGVVSEPRWWFFRERLDLFWRRTRDLKALREHIKTRMRSILDQESIVDSPHALVQCSTDATGLVMELPLLVLFPETTGQIQAIVRLAHELHFHLVPRGGGSGLTGGAVPALSRAAILSLSRMKSIISVDEQRMTIRAQAGVTTSTAIEAADRAGLLLTVDPASKSASSLGGNIAENAGGPYAFEYGTTLDNLLSYTMVRPDGQVIEIRRLDHPRHKIHPHDLARFRILDSTGTTLEIISLRGTDLRAQGLGKDVTNKFLGGLPGVQKEGVDGIITEASFVLHPKLSSSRTLCLEFYGNSMHTASLVIQDLVRLRDRIRHASGRVSMSALEEFNAKYIQAIGYRKKSTVFADDPLSVLLIRLDSDSPRLLEDTASTIVDLALLYDHVDVFVARNDEEAEIFWEDRHRLSAISKRTSGFKINEDIVIPLDRIPHFSDFLDELNVSCLARAWHRTLDRIRDLESLSGLDEDLSREQELCTRVLNLEAGARNLSEQGLVSRIRSFFKDLTRRCPQQAEHLESLQQELFQRRLEVANHMHAGDGNCHVNIPVHANDPVMMEAADEAVERVFAKALELGGQVSGEHGIGITKISYLSRDKIQALQAYKKIVDPADIFNPGKLNGEGLQVAPYTLSWERLLLDVQGADVPNKDSLIDQIRHIRTCTRCGKCKQVCPMFYPEKGILHHPRNKNISLGAILEALLYTLKTSRIRDPYVLSKLQELMEYCTACGKCLSICPVKIDSSEVVLGFRSFLEEEGAGGHPFKSRVLSFLGQEPERIPTAAKALALGQAVHNTAVKFLPAFWRKRMESPLLQQPSPKLRATQLRELLGLDRSTILVPPGDLRPERLSGVLYLPGCGAGLFSPNIGLAAVFLALEAGRAVLLPEDHLCCGYPLLSAGCTKTFSELRERNIASLSRTVRMAHDSGIKVDAVLTSCGTCQAALQHVDLDSFLPGSFCLSDAFAYLLPDFTRDDKVDSCSSEVIYHPSCHSPLGPVSARVEQTDYADLLQLGLGASVESSPHCCAESGLGALTSPGVYNRLRKRKKEVLEQQLLGVEAGKPFLVSCPSCKIGISRILRSMKSNHHVLHVLEHAATLKRGKKWRQELMQTVEHSKFSMLDHEEELQDSFL
jgi:FAD/FMN-containing dehydrogenase/Fe-S oxidoreductase